MLYFTLLLIYVGYSEASRIELTPNLEDKRKSSPKSSYQILNWVADDVLVAKYLLPLCERQKRGEFREHLEKISKEVTLLGDDVREHFRHNRFDGLEHLPDLFKCIVDLLAKCYEKQGKIIYILRLLKL